MLEGDTDEEKEQAWEAWNMRIQQRNTGQDVRRAHKHGLLVEVASETRHSSTGRSAWTSWGSAQAEEAACTRGPEVKGAVAGKEQRCSSRAALEKKPSVSAANRLGTGETCQGCCPLGNVREMGMSTREVVEWVSFCTLPFPTPWMWAARERKSP